MLCVEIWFNQSKETENEIYCSHYNFFNLFFSSSTFKEVKIMSLHMVISTLRKTSVCHLNVMNSLHFNKNELLMETNKINCKDLANKHPYICINAIMHPFAIFFVILICIMYEHLFGQQHQKTMCQEKLKKIVMRFLFQWKLWTTCAILVS